MINNKFTIGGEVPFKTQSDSIEKAIPRAKAKGYTAYKSKEFDATYAMHTLFSSQKSFHPSTITCNKD